MKLSSALQAGLAGAGALTIMHQKLQKVDEDAPRMDLLGMNALAKLLKVPFERLKEIRQLIILHFWAISSATLFITASLEWAGKEEYCFAVHY